MQLKQGTTIANRYVISDILGKGGMAIVYKARDIKLDRDVTLKVMREEFVKDDNFINRFNIEAKAAAKLTHQNIVNVYDVGKFGEIYFIVMEYIEGITLKEIIQKRGKLTNEETLGVAIQIAQALEIAHKNNIVHRDIKPQNILINAKGDVKVTDFGIARAINANTVTTGNNTMGSVHYFSPEQARGGYIDQKSDIYSLGITMYEMITGEIPFDDETVVAIALKHISEPLPKIARKNEKADQSVINIIEKATEKVSLSRFETVEIMNNDLKRALINLGKNNMAEPVETTEVPNVSNDAAHTLILNDDDITAIRSRAMTAFFDNGEMDEINRLSQNHDMPNQSKSKKPEYYFDDDEDEEDNSSKIGVIIGVLVGVILACIIAFGLYNYFDDSDELIDVPNYIGYTLEEAKEAAKEYRITISVDSSEFSDDYEEGYIIDQDFVYGSDKIKIGGTLTVITSLGSRGVIVPNVEGLNVEEAFSVLDEEGFRVEYKYEYSDTVDINVVERQVPSAFSNGESGDTITVYISRGVKTLSTFVPNLLGKTEAEAKSIISQNDLIFGQTTYEFNNEYDRGKVFAQTPKENAEVSANTVVSIFVSNGPKSDEDTNGDNTEGDNKKPNDNGSTEVKPPVTQTGTKTFSVSKIADLGENDIVTIRVVRIDNDGTPSVLYEEPVKATDLPKNVTIEGSGRQRIQLSRKINNGDFQIFGDTPVDFGE